MKCYFVTSSGNAGPAQMKVYLVSGGDSDMGRMYLSMGAWKPAGAACMGDGLVPRRHADIPLRILISYHYFKGKDINEEIDPLKPFGLDVMADSGAYSAWSLGQTITVAEYANWLKTWGHLFTCAAALDVIGDAEGSWKQTEELRSLMGGQGPEIIPVYHSTDGSFDHLDRYIAAGYKYIGISPIGAIYGDRKLLHHWLAECFRRKPADVKYHGFGVTGWGVLRAFPFYSVDSSSWISAFRYATLSLFDSRSSSPVRLDLRDPKSILQATRVLADYGLKPSMVKAVSGHNRPALCAAMIESWQRMEAFLTKRWAASTPPGTKVTLVCVPSDSAPNGPAFMAEALKGSTDGGDAEAGDGAPLASEDGPEQPAGDA